MKEIITSQRRKKHLSGHGVKAREYISKTANSTDYIAFSFRGIDMERVPERAAIVLDGTRIYFVAHDDGFSPHAENGSSTSAVINVSKSRIGDVDAFLGNYETLEYDPDIYAYYIDREHKYEPKADDDENDETAGLSPELVRLGDSVTKKKIEFIETALAEIVAVLNAREGVMDETD